MSNETNPVGQSNNLSSLVKALKHLFEKVITVSSVDGNLHNAYERLHTSGKPYNREMVLASQEAHALEEHWVGQLDEVCANLPEPVKNALYAAVEEYIDSKVRQAVSAKNIEILGAKARTLEGQLANYRAQIDSAEEKAESAEQIAEVAEKQLRREEEYSQKLFWKELELSERLTAAEQRAEHDALENQSLQNKLSSQEAVQRLKDDYIKLFINNNQTLQRKYDISRRIIEHRGYRINGLQTYLNELEEQNRDLIEETQSLTSLVTRYLGDIRQLNNEIDELEARGNQNVDVFNTEDLPELLRQSPEINPDEYINSLSPGQPTTPAPVASATPAQPAVDAHVQERQTPEEMLRLAKEAYKRGDYSSASIFTCLAIGPLRGSYVFDSDKKTFIAQDDSTTKEAKELQKKLEEIYVL